MGAIMRTRPAIVLYIATWISTMILVWSPAANGQSCGATQNCNPNLAYPYRFCNPSTGRAEIRCSNTPNAEPGLTPYKVQMPACMKFIASSSDPESSTMEDENGARLDVNLPSDWGDVVNNAVDAWNCLCGYSSENSTLNSCCIPIQWSDNPNDFLGDAVGTLGITYVPGAVTSFDRCQPQCVNGVLAMDSNGRPRVYLNNTTEFTRYNPASGLIQRSLYSSGALPNGPGGAALRPGFAVFSLRDVVTHEFGHWLGMRHLDDTPDCSPGVTKHGIMIKNTTANRDPRSLSDQDKCQFMKLYCPVLTTVPWEDVINPKRNDCAIPLRMTGRWATISDIDCDVTAVVVVDLEGRVLHNPQIILEQRSKQLHIDFGTVASGPIMVLFQCTGNRSPVHRTFLVIRDN